MSLFTPPPTTRVPAGHVVAPRATSPAVGHLAERGLLDRRVGGRRADRVDSHVPPVTAASQDCATSPVRSGPQSRSSTGRSRGRRRRRRSAGRWAGFGRPKPPPTRRLPSGQVATLEPAWPLATGTRSRRSSRPRPETGLGRGGAAARRPSSPSPPGRRVRPAPRRAGRRRRMSADGRSLPHHVRAGTALERVAGAADEPVVAGPAVELVVALAFFCSGGRGRCQCRLHLRLEPP